MKLKLPLIAAFVAILGLTACGGSGSNGSDSTGVSSPATLTTTDSAIGTGAVAATGTTVSVNYTGYLYNSSVAGFKGAQFDSSVGRGAFEFKLGANAVIPGFEQGVTGMKVGGKRTVLIPGSLGYGASGAPGIPANSGLVFDIELVTVK